MGILRPLLAETGAATIGKVVIGTVKGDIHDIGKNLVGMMLEGAGFEVIDLGINTDADEFLAALEEHKPDILGMSALLTTTMPYMKVVIDTLKERGWRDDYTVLVGGAPLNEQFAEAVGADAYCRTRRWRWRRPRNSWPASTTSGERGARHDEPHGPRVDGSSACMEQDCSSSVHCVGCSTCDSAQRNRQATAPAVAVPVPCIGCSTCDSV